MASKEDLWGKAEHDSMLYLQLMVDDVQVPLPILRREPPERGTVPLNGIRLPQYL